MKHEIDQPTYKITGPQKAFDERDSVFAREHLVPGSKEESAYYQEHPDLVEADQAIRGYIQAKQGSRTERDWRAESFYETVFGPVAPMGQPDQVDGMPAANQVAMTPQLATRRIKAMACYLGAWEVRIAPLKQAWVYSHRGAPPFNHRYPSQPPFRAGVPDHYRDLQWGDSIELKHTHAVVMAFPQNLDILRASPSPATDLEVGRIYAQSALTSVQLGRYIRATGYPARAHHLRNSAIMLVPVAVDAGLGELSRAGYLLAPTLGLNLRLSCVTTDLPLINDKPVDLGIQDFCAKCQKCARTCPAKAIPAGEKTQVRGVEKWKLDETACLAYWGKMGASCSICQTVCPWSKPDNLFHRTIAAMAINIPILRRPLIQADDLVYGSSYKRKVEPDWLTREGDG